LLARRAQIRCQANVILPASFLRLFLHFASIGRDLAEPGRNITPEGVMACEIARIL
jgi:hypothetical protein